MESAVLIKDVLLKSLVLFLVLSWVPYFDYRRLLPPEPAAVEMQCLLVSIDTAVFRVMEARLALRHLTREDAWQDEMVLLVPTVLVKRLVRCHYTGDAEAQQYDYAYNRLFPNITGFSTDAVVMELTARYEQPFRLWNYADRPAQTFRPYPFDEHLLCAVPVDRDEDWVVVYLLAKSLLQFLALTLAGGYVWLRRVAVRLLTQRTHHSATVC